MAGSGKKSRKLLNRKQTSRIQSGNIHFCVRGNCRKVVFLDDEDKVEFLQRCFKACEITGTRIEAFVIMDNHVHLQLETSEVTKFASWLLRGYSFWYNRKYSLSDKLFRTPFMSYSKLTEEWRINSILYILTNPVKAGICNYAGEYKWSSYNLLFPSTKTLVKNQSAKNDSLEETVTNEFQKLIDTSFIYKHFKTRKQLDKSIEDYLCSQREIIAQQSEKSSVSFNTRTRIPTCDVINHLKLILGDKSIHSLNLQEQKILIQKLRAQTGATYMQLSQIFNESFEYIRRIFRISSP